MCEHCVGSMGLNLRSGDQRQLRQTMSPLRDAVLCITSDIA